MDRQVQGNGKDERSVWAAWCLRVGLMLFVYLIVSSAVLDSLQNRWGMGDNWRKSEFSAFLEGRLERPFAYRVLTPYLIRAIAQWLPENALDQLNNRFTSARSRYDWKAGHDDEYVVAYLLLYSSLIGVLLINRATLMVLLGPCLAADYAPALGLLVFPLAFAAGGFVYDIPELLLASLAFYCVARGWWWLFALTLLAAAANKESAVLMALWLPALYGSPRAPERLWLHSSAAGLGAVIGLTIGRVVAVDNPGRFANTHLKDNLSFLLEPMNYLLAFDPYAAGIPLPRGLHAIHLAIVVVLLVSKGRHGLGWVRRIATLTVASILPLFIVFGYRDEVRVFMPAFPAMLALATASLAAGRRLGNSSNRIVPDSSLIGDLNPRSSSVFEVKDDSYQGQRGEGTLNGSDEEVVP